MAESCPKCGCEEVVSDECPRCRVIISKYRYYLQTLNGKPSAPASRPSPESPRAPDGAVPPTTDGAGQVRRLTFHGSGGSLFGIQIVNNLLTLITLGVYYAWAKTKVRRYIMSQSAFWDDRFAYHGTGRELFNGLFKAGLIYALPVYVLQWLPGILGLGTAGEVVAALLIFALALVVTPFAIVGSRRYRLSRTSWRGIYFSFRGSAVGYMKIFLKGSLLSLITLGLYTPFFRTRTQEFLVSHSYFGNQKFDFDGEGRDLFRPYLVALFLTIPTLGLCWFWFAARKRRYFWDHASVAAARFRSTVTGGRLFRLHLVNLLMLLITVGFAWPWVTVRNIKFAFDNLSLQGALDLSAIEQQAQLASTTGEGLAGVLDTGFDFG